MPTRLHFVLMQTKLVRIETISMIMKEHPFLPTVRELARCYQAFERFSAGQVREFGLTPSQFDVVATLGNTPGMGPKELGERTLMTKGTLTGVVDRLEAQKLVRRSPSPDDGRCQIVRLTPSGEALFRKIFPVMLAHLGRAFAPFGAKDHERVGAALRDLRQLFEKEHET